MSYAAAAYALVIVGLAAYARWLSGSARRLENEVRTRHGSNRG